MTRLLMLGILFSTAVNTAVVNTAVVAKPAILGILPSLSLIFAS